MICKNMNPQHIFKHTKRVILTLAALLCLALSAEAQEVVRITGRVVSKQNNEPLMGVNITDVKLRRALAVTDEDGRFATNAHVGTQLRFSMIGAKEQIIKVKNDKFLEVKLDEDNVSIGEVEVKAKYITDRIMPEPTDIEVSGNWLHIRTRVRVPNEMFSHDTRLVVQPILNDVSHKTKRTMRPMVYDAREYHRTQDRLYNFDMNNPSDGDPLSKYVIVKSASTKDRSGRKVDILSYNDSIYVENLKDDYSCDVYMAIEDYTHILYRDTTIIARGTVNPLRWLECPLKSAALNDASYIPEPEKQMRDSKGNINLKFRIGKARLNTDDPQNQAEIEKLRQQINAIRADKDASLQSLSLEGVSSPDGRLERNKELAQQRMDFALRYIKSQLPDDVTKEMEFSSRSSVATWQDVIKLLRSDSLNDEADKMQAVVDRYKNPDFQGPQMRRLPFFKSLLENKYLPQLRQVNYTMNYSIFRQLTIDEIKALYAADYHKLTRYEFYELYRNEPDQAKRETIQRQALEIYPTFLAAANDLSASLIDRGASDPEILRSFAGENAPESVNRNQMIALLNAGLYTAADSLAQYVSEDNDTQLLHAVNGAVNGRYLENYKTIAATGTRNKVVMLLAMKRNEEALAFAKELPDEEAATHYLRAICLNRTEDVVGATDELKRAIEMDPSLEELAHVDGDVNDLFEQK